MVARFPASSWLPAQDQDLCRVCDQCRKVLPARAAAVAGRVSLDLLVATRVQGLVATALGGISDVTPDGQIALLVPTRPGSWHVFASSAAVDRDDVLLASDLYPELDEVRRSASPHVPDRRSGASPRSPQRSRRAGIVPWVAAFPIFVAAGTAETAVLRVSLGRRPRRHEPAFLELVAHLLAHRLGRLPEVDVARALGIPFTVQSQPDAARMMSYLPLPACLLSDGGDVIHASPSAVRWLDPGDPEAGPQPMQLRLVPPGCWRRGERRWEATLIVGGNRLPVLGWSAAVGEDRWLVLLDDHPAARRSRREGRMRSALAEKVTALEEVNERLVHYASLSDRFVSDAAHELKTPLAILRSYLETLVVDLTDGMSEQQLEFVHAALEGAARLQRLVDELLDLAALESGGDPLELGPVSPRTVTEKVIEDLDALARIHDVHLASEVDDLPPVRADQARLARVLRNLIENAVKHGHGGGHATVAGEVRGDRAVLIVTDDGVGIDPETIPRIFDEFVRGVGPRGATGAGLGLAIVRRLVQAMAGRVWAESEPGTGSRFFVELPLWIGPA